MIRAILFDIGGVLSRQVRHAGHRRWEARLGLAENSLGREIYHSPVAMRAFVGQGQDADVWEDLRLRFGLSPAELDELQRDFWSDWEWDLELLELIRRLRRCYLTGVISDALPGARRENMAYVNGDTFDLILFSGEVGLLKPEAALFDRALAALGVRRDEAVFIDDTPRIVAGARALGMQAIHFGERQQMLDELAGILGHPLE